MYSALVCDIAGVFGVGLNRWTLATESVEHALRDV